MERSRSIPTRGFACLCALRASKCPAVPSASLQTDGGNAACLAFGRPAVPNESAAAVHAWFAWLTRRS